MGPNSRAGGRAGQAFLTFCFLYQVLIKQEEKKKGGALKTEVCFYFSPRDKLLALCRIQPF